eukprot:COSAG06_NODE_57652_length_279_cov_1.455556_1_plen_34_part_01
MGVLLGGAASQIRSARASSALPPARATAGCVCAM